MQISSEKELIEKLKHCDGVIIYGAGVRGRWVLNYLKSYGVRVAMFVVTVLGNEYCMNGIPVKQFSDVLEECHSHTIFVACDAKNRQEIVANLKNNGITDYITFEENLFLAIRKRSYDYIASKWEKPKASLDDRRLKIGYLAQGYNDTTYAEERLIINKLETAKAKYVALPKEISEPSDYRWVDAWYEPRVFKPDVDVIHTFNAVCITDRCWCASFETILPRLFDLSRQDIRGIFEKLGESIQKDNCLGIFPLCKNAYEIQKIFLKENLPDLADGIMNKTFVLHPPQPVLLSAEEEMAKCVRNLQEITFIFIGTGFFIKGGREIIKALSHFEGQVPFKLILISSFGYEDYFTHTSREEMLEYRKIAVEKPWIEYYNGLPNVDVLEKCKKADIGLLPSFADTYGYSVLEMQAGGCPVITTNIRAFPEINSESCGWVCKLPTEPNQCCKRLEMSELSRILEDELVSVFEEIFAHPETIVKKRIASLERIRYVHNPSDYAEKLWEVYCGGKNISNYSGL